MRNSKQIYRSPKRRGICSSEIDSNLWEMKLITFCEQKKNGATHRKPGNSIWYKLIEIDNHTIRLCKWWTVHNGPKTFISNLLTNAHANSHFSHIETDLIVRFSSAQFNFIASKYHKLYRIHREKDTFVKRWLCTSTSTCLQSQNTNNAQSTTATIGRSLRLY